MATFNFSVSRSKTAKPKPPTERKARVNTLKPLTGDIVVGVILHINGESYIDMVDDNPLKLDEASASLVGKDCYWVFQEGLSNGSLVGYYLRVQYSGPTIKEYPHPFKFKYKKGEQVHGYITANNEFHVTFSPKQKFSNRKSGSRH